MIWFELAKELRVQRSEAQAELAETVGKNKAFVIPILQLVHKLGQYEAQMLTEQDKNVEARSVLSFCDKLKSLTAG